jgi:hypothetical protein
MSDDNLKNGHNPEVSFEPEDIEARPIIIGLIGLGLACIAFYFVVLWMYGFLNRYQATHQAPTSPLATVEKDTRHVTKAEVESFPEPRLEKDERDQLDGVRINEEQRLNSYGWVDQSAGTVHIPIERAMELLVEQGVPTAPTAQPATTKNGNQKKSAAHRASNADVLAAKR